jgi:hypothetical protein
MMGMMGAMPVPPREKTEEEKNVVHQRYEWTVSYGDREYRFSAPGGAAIKEALEACQWFQSRLEVILNSKRSDGDESRSV